MSKLVQNQFVMIRMTYPACLNLFSINMIRIDNQYDINWYNSYDSSNMSKLVQNQFVMIRMTYPACLNLFSINIIRIDTNSCEY